MFVSTFELLAKKIAPGDSPSARKVVQAYFLTISNLSAEPVELALDFTATTPSVGGLDHIPDFPGLKTLIRVESERQIHRANIIEVSTETRYYVASFTETAQAFANRIRGYWGVENKVQSEM